MPHFCASFNDFVLKKAFWSESGGPPSHENSNNPLAVKPETENDALAKVVLPTLAG
jgi:hypothetical protein